jgi:predicted NBD/HSP70 family sugar kinase
VLIEIREDELKRKAPGGLAVGLGIVIGGKVHYGSTCAAGEFRSAFSHETDVSQFSLAPQELLKINSDRSIFRRFSQELAENMALLVNSLNVSHVYLSSFNVEFKNDIIPILKAKIAEKFPYPLKRECEISFSSFGDKAVAYGAAGLILDKIFAHPEIPKSSEDSARRHIKQST